MRALRQFLILVTCLCLSTLVKAQTTEDSTIISTVEDTLSAPVAEKPLKRIKDTVKRPFQPNPKKAGMFSALLPGSGQIYNRQYWKAPLVYGVLGVAGYFIATNYKQYNRYRTAYIAVIDKDPKTVSEELYGENDLKQLRDQYKQWLDMTVLLTTVGYMVQVMDAVVFAHLKNFDVSPDISMRLQPVAMPSGGMGVGLAFHLK